MISVHRGPVLCGWECCITMISVCTQGSCSVWAGVLQHCDFCVYTGVLFCVGGSVATL